jgi:hypothetical protein
MSFEWIKIFLSGFHQKIARKNLFTENVFLIVLESDKYALAVLFKNKEFRLYPFHVKLSFKFLKTLNYSNFSHISVY